MTQSIVYRGRGIRTVAVIGCGLIGAMWAAYFLHRGLNVRAWDPAQDGEQRLKALVNEGLKDLRMLGGELGKQGELTWCNSWAEAIVEADYVQENAPEKIALKQELLARIDAGLPADVVIGSSTSSFPASALQAQCASPQRVIVAHPFNPPHLVPLVELVGGERGAPAAIDAAYSFFEGIGKTPVRVAREAVGHLANRLNAALWREAVNIVAEGIASVEDVDRAVRHGPGLRWAIDGPHMLFHLGGGEGGLRAYIEHLGPAQEARWASLGTPRLDEETKRKLIEGMDREVAGRSMEELKTRRDRLLIGLLRLMAEDEASEGRQ
ncbi:3-hydroxyacyl-CoA dehydrogenase NAD-binding domain-containing protein [Mesorhizobium sp. J428]|uniref:3-hydroxyacyl-CoA dehydrogenase NAD-binding domain-containing protein n=1 Tax=Mesorhizobium sp. J428 TaxID=2898440 RepID=UPI002150A08E|nr:3-hydroxyacyl-CoA dehydrogenase NAD-binding domain-containing protein [Mesorhizobium sp. J428]MCR5858062.1 3-hydroxyacyl-CoA dehydrogenase NAD-binding domain-containing protein [Mesorhizobium sp. J428]